VKDSGQDTLYLATSTLKTELIMDELSQCATSRASIQCIGMNSLYHNTFGAKRARVEGIREGSKVRVRKLQILDASEEDDSVPVGRVFISWSKVADAIRSCAVESMSQAHSLDVTVKLKGGPIIVAVEPTIDEALRLENEVRQKCDYDSFSTE
jgi:hypothetical protein